ncbi:hypothetical protein [Enterococcus sp. AZ072]|uniref:hypothetical protein n=1 Tax=unclassified Enterococcus TaxID=2608891 RepID=UPI003D27EC79
MKKPIDKISIVFGYILIILGIAFPFVQGIEKKYTVFGAWFTSLFNHDFFAFWQHNFASGTQAMVGSGLLLLLIIFSFAEAVGLTFDYRNMLLPKMKNVSLFFLMIGVAYLQFFQVNIALLFVPGLAFIEFMLSRYLDGKPERDREYAETKAAKLTMKEDKKERLDFKGTYPKLLKKIIRKNWLFYRQDSVILVVGNLVSYTSVVLLLVFYRSFSVLHSQESIFNKTGLLRIFIESGGILGLLLLIFLTYVTGVYLSFRTANNGLWILLGIRRKTYLWMLIREYLLNISLAVVFGTFLLLPIVRVDWLVFVIAILIQLMFSVLTLAFHQEQILRLLQFKHKESVDVRKGNVKYPIIWLSVGIVSLVITFLWFSRRKSSETYFIFAPLAIGLLGIVYGGAALGQQLLKHSHSYYEQFLNFTDFFYQFRKSVSLVVLLILLQVFCMGILIPRIITYQMTEEATIFPYTIMAKVKAEDVLQLKKISEEQNAEMNIFPMLPITSVDGDPEPEMYGTQRPVMIIQGQHVGISEDTYQLLRKKIGMNEQPLHLAKGFWHVVYQQTISIQAQPIDWDPGSSLPRLRIGQPLEEYDTANVDNLFPIRQIQSEERSILTGMFQRGLQENLIVLSNKDFQQAVKEQPNFARQLVLIRTADEETMVKELAFLSEKYADERRWDESIQPFYARGQRKQNVVTENKLEMMVLIFLVIISQLLCFSLLLNKYVSEKNVWTDRQNLLGLLGIRERDRRKLVNRQLRLFLLLPIVLAVGTSMGFIFTMFGLRFFNQVERQEFWSHFLSAIIGYIFIWYCGYRWCGNQIIKWVI